MTPRNSPTRGRSTLSIAVWLLAAASGFAGHEISNGKEAKAQAEPPVREWFPDFPPGFITAGVQASEHNTGAYLDTVTGLWAPRDRDAFLFLNSRYHYEDDGQFISSTGLGLGWRSSCAGRGTSCACWSGTTESVSTSRRPRPTRSAEKALGSSVCGSASSSRVGGSLAHRWLDREPVSRPTFPFESCPRNRALEMKILRVLLADDHALVRAGVRALLQRLPDVEVVAEAGDGLEALDLIATTAPDIALLDLGMPKLNGLGATERIVRELPVVKVIILSMHEGQDYVRFALQAGAAGYIVKDAAAGELEIALRAVERGDPYLSPSVAGALLAEAIGPGGAAPPKGQLTARQREVLRLVAEGRSMKEIGSELGISVKTAEAHRAQLCERLGIHDVPGLVRYAMRHGIVCPEPSGEI